MTIFLLERTNHYGNDKDSIIAASDDMEVILERMEDDKGRELQFWCDIKKRLTLMNTGKREFEEVYYVTEWSESGDKLQRQEIDRIIFYKREKQLRK